MPNPSIAELISRIPTCLGSYAPVIEEIEAALASPQCSLGTVGEAIEKDPDLTSRLLRLGNSSFYGYSSRLATVTEAISLIGIQQVQDLIVASSIIESFSGIPQEFVSMESFWQHSLACGTAARLIALERRLLKPDKFFVAGLLHDVGRLVLLAHAPEQSKRIVDVYQGGRLLLWEAEAKVMGFDHQQIGGALLKYWKYPTRLVQAVSYHHQPHWAEGAREEATVVHFADYLVNAMRIGGSGEQHVPPLDMKSFETLRLPLDSLSPLVEAIDEQIGAVHDAFLRN